MQPDPDWPYAPRGMCLSVCLLVLACCLRFNLGVPVIMQRVLGDRHRQLTPTARANFHLALSHWHRRLYGLKTWSEFEKTGMGLVSHPLAGRCWVYIQDTQRLCDKRPCPSHAFCRRHREMLLVERRADQSYKLPCDHAIPWALRDPLPGKRKRDGETEIEVD